MEPEEETPVIQHFEGEIIRWVDGDTVVIHTWHEEVHTVRLTAKRTVTTTTRVDDTDTYRLIIVDTPEEGKPGYWEATQYAEWICPPGSRCSIITHGVEGGGGWGRTLADVFPHGGTAGVSELLLRDDFAVVWKRKR